MPAHNKVVWTDGMFLRPHHFQQQDLYVEALLKSARMAGRPYDWGVRELAIDRDLLETGQFALRRAAGLLPDGTPFSIPDDADPPAALLLSEDVGDVVVHLAVPAMQEGARAFDPADDQANLARYLVAARLLRDGASDAATEADVDVARLRLRMLLDTDPAEGYVRLPVARVKEVRADRRIVLDEDFIPPAIDCAASERLSGFMTELLGRLRQRADALSGRVSDAGRGAGELADFLMLQLVNRAEPTLAHMATLPQLHPETLYAYLVQLAGELSTFTTDERRPTFTPFYRHDDLDESFGIVFEALRAALSAVLEKSAELLPLEGPNKYGLLRSPIRNRALLDSAMFVIAVRADTPTETLRANIPAQLKVGSVEKISELVNKALPGVALSPLPAAPRQIPFHASAVYFTLDKASPFWAELSTSGGFAFHLSGQHPNLHIDFWAIKG
ncbi:MAG: type VI secretion system baseplate subunit TssK [Pseudomonadota bacterium]